MKLYGSSTLLWGKSFREICETASELGLVGIELWTEQFWQQHFTIQELDKYTELYGLKLTLHAASWDLNLCSLNEGIRKQSITEISRSITLASAINAVNITIHPGKRTLTSDWTTWHMQSLKEAIDLLEEMAVLNEVTISLELMEDVKKEFVTVPNVLNELIRNRSDKVKTTFDVAHTPIGINPVVYFKKLDRVNKIHLSDSSTEKFHVPLGEGEIQLEPIIKELQQFDHPVVLEGYDPNGQNATLKKHITYLRHCIAMEEKGIVL